MAEHNDFGNLGEKMAREYLQKKGYVIRHTNWFYQKDELDIVAEYNGELIVVEVKSRNTAVFGDAHDSITPRKIRNIVNATQGYIEQFDLMMETRFDVITVTMTKNGYQIEHIENAFMAPVN